MNTHQATSRVGGSPKQWLTLCLLAGSVLLLAAPAAKAVSFTVNDCWLGKGQIEIVVPSSSYPGWGQDVIFQYPYVDHVMTMPFASAPVGHLPSGDPWTHVTVAWRRDLAVDIGEHYFMYADAAGALGVEVTELISFDVTDASPATVLNCQIRLVSSDPAITGQTFTPTELPPLVDGAPDPYLTLAYLFGQVSQRCVPEGDSVWTTVLFALAVGGLVAFRPRRKLARAGAS